MLKRSFTNRKKTIFKKGTLEYQEGKKNLVKPKYGYMQSTLSVLELSKLSLMVKAKIIILSDVVMCRKNKQNTKNKVVGLNFNILH